MSESKAIDLIRLSNWVYPCILNWSCGEFSCESQCRAQLWVPVRAVACTAVSATACCGVHSCEYRCVLWRSQLLVPVSAALTSCECQCVLWRAGVHYCEWHWVSSTGIHRAVSGSACCPHTQFTAVSACWSVSVSACCNSQLWVPVRATLAAVSAVRCTAVSAVACAALSASECCAVLTCTAVVPDCQCVLWHAGVHSWVPEWQLCRAQHVYSCECWRIQLWVPVRAIVHSCGC